ncbi:hypothetical protein ACLOJK_024773 [Asimina triloba]
MVSKKQNNDNVLGIGLCHEHISQVQRKTAIYEFSTRSLRNFILDSILQEIHERLLPLLSKAAKRCAIVDLQDILERFAFDNVCKIAFNEDPMCLHPRIIHNHDHEEEREQEQEFQSSSAAAAAAANFAQAFEDAANLSAGRFRYAIPSLWKLKKVLNIGSEKRLKESISIIHDFATKIILSRKQKQSSSTDNPDLLSRFLMISDEDYSVEFLRDIIISFILAGRDTTSSALAWFFWVLSSRPDVERKILEELRWVRKRNGNCGPSFSFDELRQMHYLYAAMSEAMRLFPPVAYDTKECMEDDVLPDGTRVGRGWLVSYHVYAMARMENIWGSDCREFVPERWLENGEDGGAFRAESPFKFPAFNAGPRVCIGREMAYLQMKLIVACVVERLEVEAVGKDSSPEQMLSLTLRIKGGLPVHVKQRCISDVDN